MTHRLPGLAAILSVAGVIPFIVIGLATLSPTADSNGRMLLALTAWGAVVLAFLGAVHWGLVLGAPAEPLPRMPVAGPRWRLLWAVLPALAGWLALLAQVAVAEELGLAVLIAGFVGLLVLEVRWAAADLVPGGYMALRWPLTIVVVALLTTILVLRLIGARIIL